VSGVEAAEDVHQRRFARSRMCHMRRIPGRIVQVEPCSTRPRLAVVKDFVMPTARSAGRGRRALQLPMKGSCFIAGRGRAPAGPPLPGRPGTRPVRLLRVRPAPALQRVRDATSTRRSSWFRRSPRRARYVGAVRPRRRSRRVVCAQARQPTDARRRHARGARGLDANAAIGTQCIACRGDDEDPCASSASSAPGSDSRRRTAPL